MSKFFPLLQQKIINCESHNRKSHKKVCENKDFCKTFMPFEGPRIIEFNQYKKSDKAPFITCADLECLIENLDGCKNNLEIS